VLKVLSSYLIYNIVDMRLAIIWRMGGSVDDFWWRKRRDRKLT